VLALNLALLKLLVEGRWKEGEEEEEDQEDTEKNSCSIIIRE